jgi:hypothetical protein
MKTTWIIQTNMGSTSDIMEYVNAVKESGADVVEVEYIPFSQELPNMEVSGPVVAYGAVNFIKEIQNSGKWPLAVFGTPETFTYETWAENYGEMLLNSPDSTKMTTIGEFCSDNRDTNDDIFVRPQHDTKSLVGKVWIAGDFKKWCIDVSKGGYAEVDANTPIIVATPYGIEAEWRLFVVDGKVAGASQYQKNRKLYKALGAPQDILGFAEKVIAKWNPAPAYTLDLCRSAGNCYIVEAQGFNSAGQYACNVKEVAEAVNDVAVKLWKQHNKKAKP